MSGYPNRVPSDREGWDEKGFTKVCKNVGGSMAKTIVLAGQMSFDELLRDDEFEKIFRERCVLWENMPDMTRVPDGAKERFEILKLYGYGTPHWHIVRYILHECSAMPSDMRCWLNTVEPAEYWVINKKGTAEGEHIERCPYCGVHLAGGHGDVVVWKDKREPIDYAKYRTR